jgi:hypothetical protein
MAKAKLKRKPSHTPLERSAARKKSSTPVSAPKLLGKDLERAVSIFNPSPTREKLTNSGKKSRHPFLACSLRTDATPELEKPSGLETQETRRPGANPRNQCSRYTTPSRMDRERSRGSRRRLVQRFRIIQGCRNWATGSASWLRFDFPESSE